MDNKIEQYLSYINGVLKELDDMLEQIVLEENKYEELENPDKAHYYANISKNLICYKIGVIKNLKEKFESIFIEEE